jgi:hypothetical protein
LDRSQQIDLLEKLAAVAVRLEHPRVQP